MLRRRFRLIPLLALLLSSVLIMAACGNVESGQSVVATPTYAPSFAPSEAPALINGLEEATEMVCELKNQPEGSHQYTALDFALAEDEDDFVQTAILFRDAGRLSEGNIYVITQNSSTVITYGEPDDIYRYTDKCSLEIRNGDTVSYYVEDYETGEVVHFAFRCSELEDGTPHFESVDGTR